LENITTEIVKELILKNGIGLKATQDKICIPIINRMYKKMKGGIKFSDIYVKDGKICDGHHRFIASLLAEYPIDSVPGENTSATSVVPWRSVTFVEDDYDSPEVIARLNEQDAKYNGIPIAQIVELLK